MVFDPAPSDPRAFAAHFLALVPSTALEVRALPASSQGWDDCEGRPKVVPSGVLGPLRRTGRPLSGG